jgi:hypothetical protein
MSETEHTSLLPLTWNNTTREIRNAEGYIVVEVKAHRAMGYGPLLVRAVNAHDDLLTACERILDSHGECSKSDVADQVVRLRVPMATMAAVGAAVAKANPTGS